MSTTSQQSDEIELSLKEYEEGISQHFLTQKPLSPTTIFSQQDQTFTSVNREDEKSHVRRVKSELFVGIL